MSKTNLSILLATTLLGVLLWLINGIVREAAVPVAENPVATAVFAVSPAPADDGLPRIVSFEDLRQHLDQLGLDSMLMIQVSLAWLDSHGFIGPDELYGRDMKSSPRQAFELYDDASLLALAGGGDIGAMQLLAERSLRSDPADAMDWFRQAASFGSVEAMISIGFLLSTWNASTQAFDADPDYRDKVQAELDVIPHPERESLAWLLTAATSGGLPIMRPGGLALLIPNRAARLGDSDTQKACERSQSLLIELAAERRARGEIVFTVEPPPVFLGADSLDNILPCRYSMMQIIDTSACAAQPVTTRRSWPDKLWLCNTPQE